MTKKMIDWETLYRSRDRSNGLRNGFCRNCHELCEPDNCPIWASLEDAPSVIDIECSVCGAQITEYLDTGEREIREAGDPDVVTGPKDCGDPPDGEGLMSYRKEPRGEKRKAERRTKPFLMSRKGARK